MHSSIFCSRLQLFRIVIAIVSGVMITASLEPYGFWPLGILAIAILLYLVTDATPIQAFFHGWLFGVGMFSTGVGWIYTSITAIGYTPWPVAELLISCFVVFMASILGIFLWVFRKFSPSTPLASLLMLPAIWVLVEWCRYWPLSGLPWLYAGGGHISSPLGGWIPLLGALGTSYWVAFTGAAGLLFWKHRAVVWLLVMSIPWVIGFALKEVDWVTPSSDELSVALVQSHTPLHVKWEEGGHDEIVNRLQTMTKPIEGAEIVVWPESAVPKPYSEVEHWLNEVGRQVLLKGATLITGIRDQRFEEGQWNTYNSVVFLNRTNSFYDKRHLVPFGEFVPLEKWIRGLIPYFDLPNSHSSPGATVQAPVAVGGWRIASLVCYEIAFANTVYKDAQAADLLLVVSNGNWFGKSIEIWQQYEMARLRALENGRPLIQASNDGITVVIDHKGEVLAEAEPYKRLVLSATVTKVVGRTPFSYWGDRLAVIAASLIVLAFSTWRLARR
ncbi:MAG: apolipoprotein N-acyltransferase [Halioglobus sp.]